MHTRFKWATLVATLVGGLAVLASGCGGSSEGGGTTNPPAGGKGGTMILLANANPGTADPAINYTLQLWQLLIITHDGLVQFRHAGGEAGTELVPDLAESIPEPQNGGKDWTFHVRTGIKFSNGMTLKPSDFKFTFERMFDVHGPTSGSFYSVIKGADACLAAPSKHCDLSAGIGADDNASTVTFHLTTPDPEFLQKLALPFAFVVPPDSPLKDVGSNPLPGTGPYKFESYIPNKELKLVRNPFFKEWSKEAQPEGKPDTILYKFGLTVEAEVTQVENGQADWVFDPLPSDRLPEVSEKYADQLHINPLTAVWYFSMDTRTPPFNNLKARQAVNYAADRDALVKIAGGPELAQPTCQVLPPNFPGYKPYCPYTAGGAGEKWTGPDMEKAQQLIEESGTKGQKVAVIGTTDEVGKALALYFQGLLNKLGYKASLKLLGAGPQYEYIQNSQNNPQFAQSSWYQDYPAASDFINVLLSCSAFRPNSSANPNLAEFCNPAIDAKIKHALETAITDPDAANELWAEIDKEITDQAPWAAMYNPKLIDFVSKRVSGYQFSPQWYFLLDQASVQE